MTSESHGGARVASRHSAVYQFMAFFSFVSSISLYIRAPARSSTVNCSSCFMIIITVSLLLLHQAWSYFGSISCAGVGTHGGLSRSLKNLHRQDRASAVPSV